MVYWLQFFWPFYFTQNHRNHCPLRVATKYVTALLALLLQVAPTSLLSLESPGEMEAPLSVEMYTLQIWKSDMLFQKLPLHTLLSSERSPRRAASKHAFGDRDAFSHYCSSLPQTLKMILWRLPFTWPQTK